MQHGSAAICLRSPAIIRRKPMTWLNSRSATVFGSQTRFVTPLKKFQFLIGRRSSLRPDRAKSPLKKRLENEDRFVIASSANIQGFART